MQGASHVRCGLAQWAMRSRMHRRSLPGVLVRCVTSVLFLAGAVGTVFVCECLELPILRRADYLKYDNCGTPAGRDVRGRYTEMR